MPDAELLVFRVLDRPPREGEWLVHVGATYPVGPMRGKTPFPEPIPSAVVPVEDYIAGAVERLYRQVGDHVTTKTITRHDLRECLLPPPPEPDVPEWVRECAKAYWNTSMTQNDNAEADLARHIAKHWEGAKDA